MENVIKKWVVSVLAVAGAFFISGFGSAFIAIGLGFWHTPVAGFCAAASVVLSANLTAPSHRKEASAFVFVVGSVLAWFALRHSVFPENYPHPYQPTHIPYLFTLLGGGLALAVCFIPFQSIRKSLTHHSSGTLDLQGAEDGD